MRLSSKRREENLAEQRYDEMQRQSVTVLSCLVKSLHHELGTWKKITHGDSFSALTLLEDLYSEESEYRIPYSVYKAIYDLIDMQNEETIRQSTLWAVLESSCKSTDETFFNQMYRIWLNELGDSFLRPKKEKVKRIQDARIKLILRLIYFDHFIRGLSDAYEASHETSYGQNELFGFLQTRFRQQQYFLPSALCGNLFGLKKTDDEDIILFRQFAFGRSLMKDLPYLRTDSQGSPAGPHVILLSGSSWAEGSYEYHVNRPVNYILEADSEKRVFLEKMRFFESGFPERISGASDDQRMAQLRSATQKAVELIVREYERKAGKILLVVNSYSQAQEVQQLQNDYKKLWLLKEDSLKNALYFHLRTVLGELLDQNDMRIFTEFTDCEFKHSGYRPDMVIAKIDPDADVAYWGDAVTECVAIIELKYKTGFAANEEIYSDYDKLKYYIDTLGVSGKLYMATIWECEDDEIYI